MLLQPARGTEIMSVVGLEQCTSLGHLRYHISRVAVNMQIRKVVRFRECIMRGEQTSVILWPDSFLTLFLSLFRLLISITAEIWADRELAGDTVGFTGHWNTSDVSKHVQFKPNYLNHKFRYKDKGAVRTQTWFVFGAFYFLDEYRGYFECFLPFWRLWAVQISGFNWTCLKPVWSLVCKTPNKTVSSI